MVVSLMFLLLGLILLIVGAELLVRGASRLALKIGISPLVIGLTVVAFGTSAPELAVAIKSGFEGQPDLLLGNILGSNIFNVLFILGISALITPLVVTQKLVRIDIPIMIGLSVVLYLLAFNGEITWWESFGLFLVLIIYLVYQFYEGKKGKEPEVTVDLPEEFKTKRVVNHWAFQLFLVAAGLTLLVFGSRWLVSGAVEIAEYLGLSSLVIGLTIVAAGTSMPEVATSVMAGIRGERDIAVGNIVGSNIFNILGIIGIAGVLIPESISVSSGVLGFDLPVMIAVAVACLPIFFTGHRIARWEGILFLAYYVIFTLYLVLRAQQHDYLPLFNNVMLLFVLPITVVTLAVIAFRELMLKKSSQLS